jgi:putative DNA primase/helicase
MNPLPDAVIQFLRQCEGAPTDRNILPPEFSEDWLALRFSDLHGSDWRYVEEWRRWLHWDGNSWQPDKVLDVFDLVRQICRAGAVDCPEPRNKLKLTSAPTVAAVERLARSDKRHAATTDQWDSDAWVLNTPKGIVDLRTGDLRKSSRDDYCTKTTAVSPSQNEDCSLWMAFLDRVTASDQELKGFLQRVCGYALTGTTREQALFFLYGPGGNGKSVFLSTIARILDDYAKIAPAETFVNSSTDRHPTDLAGLQGARLVTASEVEQGRSWNETRIKTLTGGEPIAARFMRQDFFAFTPVFKLVIAGNHKPTIRSVNEAMSRRINLIPFKVMIPRKERDPELGDKLKFEWPGILRWMIDGCLEWQRLGLNPPAIIRDATDEYLATENKFALWMEDCCVKTPNRWSSSSKLFTSWSEWCLKSHADIGSTTQFSENLQAQGIKPHRKKKARGFIGVRLRDDAN